MPELPEVETVRRGLAVMLGARIDKVELRRADIRFPFFPSFAKRLTGQRIIDVQRRAEYLLFRLDGGETLIAHLGMSGSFRMEKIAVSTPGKFHHERSKDPKHDHVVLVLDNGWVVTYNDPRRFGFMDLAPTGALHEHVRMRGLAPSRSHLNSTPRGSRRCSPAPARRSKPLCSTRSGSLDWATSMCRRPCFRAGLSPSKPASILANARGGPTRAAAAVAKAIRDVLEEAVEAGGSTLRDHRQANGELGYFQHVFKVYDREGLPCMRERCRGIGRQDHPGWAFRPSTARNASTELCAAKRARSLTRRRAAPISQKSV